LECHLAAGTDVATALAAVDRTPAPHKPARTSATWQLGLVIGLVVFLALFILWR
jgi:hypothetical protein